MPHDESMKFMLMRKDKESLEKVPFEGLEDGILTNTTPLPEDNSPPAAGMLSSVGRNFILFKIVNALKYSEEEADKRLIHVFGKNGTGKTFIAKSAARYTFERRNFEDGVIYLDIK